MKFPYSGGFLILDESKITLGDVTRDDSQRRSLAQHSVAMLEPFETMLQQCCNAVLR